MDVQCVIAVGGRGTRLGSLTRRRPKPMMPVCGEPFLAWLLARLRAHGVRRFVLLTGYRSADIVRFFGDGRAHGCAIRYSREQAPLGTGGALRAARELLEDHFLFVNGDDYPQIDYRAFMDAFRRRGKLAQVAVCPDPEGRLHVDRGSALVQAFSEQGPFLDCGTKALSRQAVDLLAETVPVNLEPALWPALIERRELTAFELGERPRAIDTPQALAELRDWLTPAAAERPPGAPLRPRR
jgi:NDP-sugar pyrophosphorylase family protein